MRSLWTLIAIGFAVTSIGVAEAASAPQCQSLFQSVAASTELHLRSRRLDLRPLKQADADDIYRISNHPLVEATLGGSPDRAQLRDYIEEIALNIADLRKDPARTGFAIVYKGQVIGSMTIQHFIWDRVRDGRVSTYTLGYFIDPAWQGKGFATEATARLLDFLFHEGQAYEVRASIYPYNLASRRVLEKNGLTEIRTGNPEILTFSRKRQSNEEDAESLKLKTQRLEMRPLVQENSKELAQISSHPDVAPMLGLLIPPDVSFYEKYISGLVTSKREFQKDGTTIDLGIFREGRLVGTVSAQHARDFISRDQDSISTYEIGFLISSEEQGKGYAREAVTRMVQFLMNEGRAIEIQAEVFESNVPSRALLEKLGFTVLSRSGSILRYHLKRAA